MLAVLAALALAPTPARAQRVNATISGRITAGPSAGQPEADVTATNVATNAVTTAKSDKNGNYILAGLPPGQYLIAVSAPSGGQAVQLVDIGVAQDATLDFDTGAAGAAPKGVEVIEIAQTLGDTRTSEVGTNITQTQISNLPQNSRNFLNFAQLAPGVRVSNNEVNRNFSSGALEARNTNVFVDGVSLKNNIIEGGVVGQDSSRGNPFPQLAVAGFRVLTQNFKAEYEQAGAAIISTLTRSGGNDYHGEVFGAFQNKPLTAIDPFVEKRMEDKPSYTRYQVGGLASGPIIKDKLFALITYEGNYQNRNANVTIGMRTPENLARFGQFEGTFTSPFREHLGFAKLSWIPAPTQTLDLTFSLRHETDIRSFGPGGTAISFQAAENVRNDVITTQLRHQWRLPSGIVNEANLQFLQTEWNPSPENPDIIGQDFDGIIRIGGRDAAQDIIQRAFTLRDDVTLPTIEAAGQHVFKGGAKIAFQRYDVDKSLASNPVFRYHLDVANNLDYTIPFEATFGVGDPTITANNIQLGFYVQDDWQVTPKLSFNLGVRWDIETHPLNNDFETPADVRASATELAAIVANSNGPDFFPVDKYLTDGSQRPVYFGQIQPRLGVNYDVFGDTKTVLFAGAGRYYDRTLFNTSLDELYRLQYAVRTFRFSRDGLPRDGNPTTVWNDNLLSKEALQSMIDNGTAPKPEIFLMENDTRPLHTDQYSLGVRQAVGPVNLTLTFSHIRGENGVGFYPANRMKTGNRDFIPTPGNFGNVLISADDIQTRFTGFFLTADKPYTDRSRWGASATYTLGWAKVRGDTFNFDFPTIKDTPLTPASSDERQRLILSGIVRLPLDFRMSTLITLGTGTPFNVIDNSAGFGSMSVFRRNAGRADGFIEYKQVDLRIGKDFNVYAKQVARFYFEIFNLFNWYNYGDYNGDIPPSANPPNPDFGKPRVLVGPTRSAQVGLSYAF